MGFIKSIQTSISSQMEDQFREVIKCRYKATWDEKTYLKVYAEDENNKSTFPPSLIRVSYYSGDIYSDIFL